jgi:hypothetical protein
MYKMLYPLVKTVIPFSAVSVRPFENDIGFSCHVNRDLASTILSGNILYGLRFKDEDWLLTVAALQAEKP